jgi:DNA-nicking Smr family endonuclease
MAKGNRKGPADKSPEDQDLWQKVTEGVRPLKGREHPKPPEEGKKTAHEPPAGKATPTPPKTPLRGAPEQATQPIPRASGINRRDAERLKRGKMQIDAYLDLHGMTLAQAHQALRAFVVRSQASERRCLLVITGTGRTKEGGGALRRELPQWLAEPGLAGRVLGLEQAQPQHGGAGAFYLLLRRKREA